MPISNTQTRYGSVAKVFHWLTALLILTAIPLGLIANGMEISPQTLPLKAQLFSIHKTLGIAAFFVALLRIIWAISQTKPNLLNGDKPLESFAAELVHWLLYLSLVIVPLSGWIHHAATTGFAPILWPFGQSLPLVPKSEAVAAFFSSSHYVFTKVLGVAVLLHIAGALKHHVVDKDATLRRMWFGGAEANGFVSEKHSKTPALVALGIYAGAFALAAALAGQHKTVEPAASTAPTEVASGWTVTSGELSIIVKQFGSNVTGTFSNWTASIDYDETLEDQQKGEVSVSVAIGSLTLGSVTDQALGPDFFDAAGFPTAEFSGPIIVRDGAHVIEGTLQLKGAEVPLTVPFELEINGDAATATGQTTTDRRDFGIGDTYTDTSALDFPVQINISLTAERSE